MHDLNSHETPADWEKMRPVLNRTLVRTQRPGSRCLGLRFFDAGAKDARRKDGVFLDPEYGVGGEIPEGWVMRSSGRWGAKGTTIFFQDPDHPRVIPSLYYKIFPEQKSLSPAEITAWLNVCPPGKEAQRIAGERLLQNRPDLTERLIRDRPALSWMADFTRNGEPWSSISRSSTVRGDGAFFHAGPGERDGEREGQVQRPRRIDRDADGNARETPPANP